MIELIFSGKVNVDSKNASNKDHKMKHRKNRTIQEAVQEAMKKDLQVNKKRMPQRKPFNKQAEAEILSEFRRLRKIPIQDLKGVPAGYIYNSSSSQRVFVTQYVIDSG